MKNAPITKGNESAKNQDNSITVTGKDEPRIDSRLIAKHLGRQHKTIMALVDRYKNHIKALGHMTFKKACGEREQGGGTQLTYVLLNEDQCYFLLNLSRNSERVVNLKLKLVLAFKEARHALNIHQTEYLPTYHRLHDAIARIAGGSSNERFIHMNVNKAINQAIGVKSGNRHNLTFPGKSALAIAQLIASNAMATASNHKDGYESAKQALHGFKQALDVAGNDQGPQSSQTLIGNKGASHE